jgi:TP901 family phage tail tape measure protein
MADRSIIVRLRAEIGDYQAKMGQAAQATEAFGTKAEKLSATGRNLTTGLTLPLAAVGIAASKLALDFEQSFSRMEGLAGVSSDEVEGLRDSVLSLSGETGKAPQELAEALYFVRSAGLDGQDALDALEASAKGAAAGLGQTQQVADAVTSAMNGYGAEVLSAAEATDVLVATAREGKAEAADLAPQFGRLIPIASELGVSFDQVGAGMAFLSRASGDASLSATQLDGVMQKLLRPSQQGAQALAEVGISTDSIRESIRENGLLETLSTLRDQLGESGFVKFFDDVQGLQGALQLTGSQADEARGVFAALADSAGATDDAFAKWAETMGFKNQKAFAELQAALIGLGDQLIPLVGKFAEFASVVSGWFTELDDGAQAMVVTFGIFVAALGPAITVAGRLTVAVRAMGTAYAWAKVQAGLFATGGLGAMSLAAPAAIAALVAVGAAINEYGKQSRDAKSDGEEWATSFAGQFDPSKASMAELRDEIARLNGAADEMQGHADRAINPFLDDRLKTARDETRALAAPLEEVAARAAELEEQLGITADEALDMATNQGIMEEATDTATGAIDEEAAALALASSELQGYQDALAALFDPVFAMQDALSGETAARQALTDAIAAHGPASAEAATAQDALTRSMVDTDAAALALRDAVVVGDVSIEAFRTRLAAWVEQGRYTQEQANALAAEVEILTGTAEGYAGTYNATVTANTSQAMWSLDQVLAKMNEIRRLAAGWNPFAGMSASAPQRTTGLRFAAGGMVPQYLASGGHPGGPVGTDTIPAWLTPGEFVLQKSAAERLGPDALAALNAGSRFASAPMATQGAGGATVVYNYTIVASSIDERHMARSVRDAIEAGHRRGIRAVS